MVKCPNCFTEMKLMGTETFGYFNLCEQCRHIEEKNAKRLITYTASLDGVTVVDADIEVDKNLSEKEIIEAVKNDLYNTFEIHIIRRRDYA